MKEKNKHNNIIGIHWKIKNKKI